MGKRDRPASEKKSRKRVKTRTIADDASDGPKTKALNAAKEQYAEKKTSVTSKAKETRKAKGKKAIFKKKKIDLDVSLYPGSLRDCEGHVEDSVGKLLLKYSEGLGGVLMAYDNVKLKVDGSGQGRGWILNELPHIHYSASCDALVFRPQVGCELHGVVVECFPSHIGILVFNFFNAMISAEQLRSSGFSFDADLQNWTSGDGTKTLSGKDKIHFEVQKIHECEGTVSLEGINPSRSLLVET